VATAPRRWLVKTEPSTYAFGDLVREGRTAWTGVKNAQAQIHLKAMRAGDEVLVYHTGDVKAVVGVARVVRAAYADPTGALARLSAVDLEPVRPLAAPVPLAALRRDARLARWELLTNSRLSVMPVPDPAWAAVSGSGGSGGRA
jgi:predicted RNA-binding protein with PUA-like domain